MNIWMLQAYDQPNGQSTRTALFAETFVGLGHNVRFFTNAYCHFLRKNRVTVVKNHLNSEIRGYQVTWLKTLPYRSNVGRVINMFENMFRILKASKDIEEKPDVIIAPSVPPLTALAGYILSRKLKAQFVYEVRDVWPSALINSGVMSSANPLSILFSLLESFFYKKCDLIVSTLENIHSHAERKGASKEKIIVVPNGLPITVRVRKATSKITLSKEKINITYIGQFSLVHDVLVFLKAAHILKNETKMNFNFFGDGPGKKKCQEFAECNGLANVTFYEHLPAAEIMAIQEQSDILIAGIVGAAHFQYGLNLNKIMYYVASGKPIIFAGNEKPKILQKYKLGYCANAGDWQEIVKLIDEICLMNSKELKALSKRAKSAFDKEINIQGLANKYNNALIDLFEG